jgi:hypothetical protein
VCTLERVSLHYADRVLDFRVCMTSGLVGTRFAGVLLNAAG